MGILWVILSVPGNCAVCCLEMSSTCTDLNDTNLILSHVPVPVCFKTVNYYNFSFFFLLPSLINVVLGVKPAHLPPEHADN